MVREHLRSNVVGYVALFVALCGVPAAFAIGSNTIGSKQLKPNSVKESETAANSVGSREVIDDSLGAGDINEGSLGQVPSAQSADTATTAGNADTLDGQDSSSFLGANAKAADANQLDGQDSSAFADASGDPTCCAVIGKEISLNVPYNPAQPGTFVDLGGFEVRSRGVAGEGVDICNTDSVSRGSDLMIGGTSASTSDIRSTPTVAANTCTQLDYNAADAANGLGDFTFFDARDQVVVFGVGGGTVLDVLALKR